MTDVKITNNHYILKDNTNMWTVYGPTAFIKQHDNYSCGPIACLKLLDVFGCFPATIVNLDDLTGQQLRTVVMDCYDAIRKDMEDDIRLVNKRKRKDAPGSKEDDKKEAMDKDNAVEKKKLI